MEEEEMNPVNKLLKEYKKKNKLAITFSAAGLVVFLLIVITFSFKGKLGLLFPKPFSRAANNTQAGTVRLSATFNSAGIELPINGDDNNNATATVEFKKSTDATWRRGLDLWKTVGSGDGLQANAGATAESKSAVAGIVSQVNAQASGKDCTKTSVGFTPLNDLGTENYQSKQGGLYPGGSNSRPAVHETAGASLADQIQPLKADGTSDPNGKYVLVTIGMSNAFRESSVFVPAANSDSAKDPHLLVVNGAQVGVDSKVAADPTSAYWNYVNDQLSAAGVTPQQVVAAWVKEAKANPSGNFPGPEQNLQADLSNIARNLKSKFPNIKMAYYSSRIYAGYATGGLNPEPYAYQGGFAVKWMIEDQINGVGNLKFDGSSPVAPWLSWGPYIWADGTKPRSDGLTWECSDLDSDGTHPADAGKTKVSNKLLDFFKTDSVAKKWFLTRSQPLVSPTPIPSPTPTATPAVSPTPTSTPQASSVPTATSAPPEGGGFTGAFYGSLLQLDQNTTYDIKITLSDPDGIAGSGVITTTIKTREDNIVSASTLSANYFVRADGSDSNSGTSDSTTGAWKTLDKALSAPSGAIVQVGPGFFTRPTTVRTIPITLKAQFPAIDDNRNVINEGSQSIIDQGVYTSPTGSSDANPGIWQQVTVVGPGFTGAAKGTNYKIWKWNKVVSGNYAPSVLGYSNTRAGFPKRLAKWDRKGSDMATLEGWVEKLYTNQSYQYGWTDFDNPTGGKDIYLRMPTDLNPNNYYLIAGDINVSSNTSGSNFFANGPNIRLSGFYIRLGGVEYQSGSSFGVVDHNYLVVAEVNMTGTKPGTYPHDNVVQYNRMEDSNLWPTSVSDPFYIPWIFIKNQLTNADGSKGGSINRIGASAEQNGGRGQGQNSVWRYNSVDGTFNGFGTFNEGYDRYAAYGNDIHDNVLTHINDDTFEPEQHVINWRIWNNRIEDAQVILSTGPVGFGPVYLFRNQAVNVGTIAGNENAPHGHFFKYSGSSNPTARVYIIHNTFWTNKPEVNGAINIAGGGNNNESFYLRNNIIRNTRYVMEGPDADTGKWNEDSNQFATTDQTRGLHEVGKVFSKDVAGYRAAYQSKTGLTTNSNILWDGTKGDFLDTKTLDDNLSDSGSGNLALKTGSGLIDAGSFIPNIDDICGVNFKGAAPDLGAVEANSNAPCPTSVIFPTIMPLPTGLPSETPTPTSTPNPTTAPVTGDPSITSGPTVTTSASSVTITWITNKQTSSKISFSVDDLSPTVPMDNTPEIDIGKKVTDHSVTINNLQPCTKYFYRVISKDSQNKQTDKDNSFITSGCTGGSSVVSETSDFVRSIFGGTISLLDSSSKGLHMVIPNLFASKDAFFQVKQLEVNPVISQQPLPSGTQTAGNNIYDINAYTNSSNELSSFNTNLTVTINYSSSDVVGIDEKTLKIYRFNNTTNSWESLPNCSVDTTSRTVACQTAVF